MKSDTASSNYNSIRDNNDMSMETTPVTILKDGSYESFQEEEMKEASDKTKFLFLALGGLLALTPTFVCFASTDVMNNKFAGMQYSFYCVIPQYACIPFVVFLTKLLDKLNFSMTGKFFVAVFGTAISMVAVAMFTFILEPTNFNFVVILCIFLSVFTFGSLFQTYIVQIASCYPVKWISYYFVFQPIGNIMINIIKNIIKAFKVTDKMNFTIIYGYFLFLVVLAIWRFLILSTSCEKFNHSFMTEESKKKEMHYGDAWKVCKREALGVFFTMFLCFMTFPGMYFSAFPLSWISSVDYFLIINSCAALFAWLGRMFALKSYVKQWVTVSFGVVILANIFMIIVYLQEWNFKYEGVCYICIPLISYMLFRNAFSTSYFFIQSSKKSDHSNRDGIGSIMSNILTFGICAGNMTSLLLNAIKTGMYK